MKTKVLIKGIVVLILIFEIMFISCSNGTGTTRSVGRYYAGRDGLSPSRSVVSRAAADTIGGSPIDEFAIELQYTVGENSQTGCRWGIFDFDDRKQVPITTQFELGTLEMLIPIDTNNFCDVILTQFWVYQKGNTIITLPGIAFIKGEQFRYDCQEYLLNTYPYANVWGSTSVVIPFDGVDLTREFDLKCEWNISSLIPPLNNILLDYNDGGPFNPFPADLENFYKSFDLKVIYKD